MRSDWSPRFDVKPLSVQAIRSTDSAVVRGAALFYQKGCLYCHRVGNEGGRKGPDLTAIASRLSDEEMRIRIVNGGSEMPAYGGLLKKEELAVIVAFLKTRK
jgi:ubiquinol-cytochrome c reductase cytochrome b subunit